MVEPRYRPIEVGAAEVAFSVDGQRRTFSRTRLPEGFVSWIVEGRNAMYDLLEGHGSAQFFGTHLPVVVTQAADGGFPFNTGNKGVGLAPKPERVDDFCDFYTETFKRYAGKPWEESLSCRLGAVRQFINGPDVSDEVLISLEIFEKKTFANLCRMPLATLHYTGEGPVYRSYQINAVVQIVPPEHPVYRFAFLSRQLFEYDSFHITQTQFPYAYVFFPVEVLDKTPYPRRDGLVKGPPPKEWSEMSLVWEEQVLEQLSLAPAFVQKFIIKVTEEFARTSGNGTVNLAMFSAVRAEYLNGKRARQAQPSPERAAQPGPGAE